MWILQGGGVTKRGSDSVTNAATPSSCPPKQLNRVSTCFDNKTVLYFLFLFLLIYLMALTYRKEKKYAIRKCNTFFEDINFLWLA